MNKIIKMFENCVSMRNKALKISSIIWEDISRQYVRMTSFSPLCLMLAWFSNLFTRIFVYYLNYVLSFIFGIGFSFCIKERTIHPILSWKFDLLAGNILPWYSSIRGWDLLFSLWCTKKIRYQKWIKVHNLNNW